MIKILIFISLLAAQTRLDPHGMKSDDLKNAKTQKKNECLICHTHSQKGFLLSRDYADRCTDCHNKAPHSGVLDHPKQQCISCHRPHRALLPDQTEKESGTGESNSLIDLKREMGEYYHFEKAYAPMLKKSCRDCHGEGKW